eukprot:2411135-Pyramimonas_sp.AAC.1
MTELELTLELRRVSKWLRDRKRACAKQLEEDRAQEFKDAAKRQDSATMHRIARLLAQRHRGARKR